MYQQRNQQQPIVPVSYDSPKMMQLPQRPIMQGQRQMQPSTFMQQPLPIPTQIQQQRTQTQAMTTLQESQQAYDQQQYVTQVQVAQRQRFLASQSPKQFKSEEQLTNQGGAPPKKGWMGDDVYLVAFLLSVEVERLREENEKFYAERDMVEQKARALGIVETELREARQKMGEYEKRHALLSSELEGYKSRQQTKEQESEEGRYQQDFQRRITVDREIRELTSKFISDRSHLEDENQKLRQDLDQAKLRLGSVEDILASADATLEENNRIRRDLDNYRQSFEQLEYVFKTATELEQENEYLKKQMQERPPLSKSEDVRLLSIENADLKRLLQLKNPAASNVERLQKELMMFEAENKRLRARLGDENVDGAFCY